MQRRTLFGLLVLCSLVATACAQAAPTPEPRRAPTFPPTTAPRAIPTLAQPVVAVAQVPPAVARAALRGPEYHFVMVSHIGAADPNMAWFKFAIEDFQKRFPEVKVDYLATDQFSVDNLVSLLRQAVAAHPDGIVAPIVSAEAEGPALQDAARLGIPVIAVNTIPSGDKTVPYLVYVGGDQYKDGVVMARAILDAAAARKIPFPRQAVCANPDIAHQGLVTRCKGFDDTMAQEGVKSEMFDISTDPAAEGTIMQAYLAGHPEVDAIFSTTARTGPVVWKAANALHLAPDVDGEGVTIVSTDESPVSLEGVKAKHLLATFGQGFYLQGFTPFEILFFNRELGYQPTADVLSGPLLIDASNIDKWIPLTRNAFKSEYDAMAKGAWE